MPVRRQSPLLGAAVLLGLLLGAVGGAEAQFAPAPQLVPQPAPTPVSPAVPSSQGVDAFTVSGITVDVNASDANAAREQAIAEAQRKAWGELHRRMTPGGAAAPDLSAADLGRLVQAFSIDDERVSATRYIATMTVRFRPDPVRDLLAGSGAARYVEPPTRPLVVLPVTVVDGRPILWEDRTPWRAAWEERQPGASLVPLLVPDGELSDISAIGVNEALAGDPTSITNIAQRHNAGGVVVARAILPSGDAVAGGASVEVTLHGLDGTRTGKVVDVRADPAVRPTCWPAPWSSPGPRWTSCGRPGTPSRPDPSRPSAPPCPSRGSPNGWRPASGWPGWAPWGGPI